MTRSNRLATRVLAAVAVLGLAVWTGCGDDDDGDGGGGVTYTGSITGALVQAPALRRPSAPPTLFARLTRLVAPTAEAQSSCQQFLACTNDDDGETCRAANDDCEFTVSGFVSGNANGRLFFVDDTNGNGEDDSGEERATLTNAIGTVCDGMVVTLSSVSVNFRTGLATAASFDKDPNTCPGASPNPTSTPGGSSTPLPTSTTNPAATATPTQTQTPTATATTAPTATGTPEVSLDIICQIVQSLPPPIPEALAVLCNLPIPAPEI